MTTTFKPMWYATEITPRGNIAILQRQACGGWLALESMPIELSDHARREVVRRNEHLRQVYADNGIVLS